MSMWEKRDKERGQPIKWRNKTKAYGTIYLSTVVLLSFLHTFMELKIQSSPTKRRKCCVSRLCVSFTEHHGHILLWLHGVHTVARCCNVDAMANDGYGHTN